MTRELLAFEAFINPGPIDQDHWPIYRNICIMIGAKIAFEERADLANEPYVTGMMILGMSRAAVHSMAMNELWEPAQRLTKVLEGAPEPEIKVGTLRELEPYFRLSERMSEFIKPLIRADYSPAVRFAAEAIRHTIQPATTSFSRIRKLEATTKILGI